MDDNAQATKGRGCATLFPDHREIISCKCGDTDYMAVIAHDDEEAYLEVHLNPERGLLRRIATALRYVMGHRSVYGCFDEIILSPADAGKWQELADFLRERQEP